MRPFPIRTLVLMLLALAAYAFLYWKTGGPQPVRQKPIPPAPAPASPAPSSMPLESMPLEM
ncbi:MAG: hypothetical protein FWG75_04255 [Cystobacterineae bacterium]|nr:hypothetical protein [Cystobacterineae bacterium]